MFISPALTSLSNAYWDRHLASHIQSNSAAPQRDAIQNAFREQLAIDHVPNFLDGLRLLAHHLGGHACLQAALQIDESRMLQIAGEMCASQPELLADLDVRNASWRRVWTWSIRKQPRLWQGLSDPNQVAQNLLTVVAEGSSVDLEILQLLAQEPQSDLTLHPDRRRLWSPLQTADATVASAFLESTAEGWLRRLRATVSGKAVEPTYDANNTQLEIPLLKVIIEDTRLKTHLMRRGRDQSAFGVELLCAFDSASQALALSWLESLLMGGDRITVARAKQFGALVARKEWSDVAKHMAKSLGRQHSEDWLPALRECTSLLPTLDRFMVKARLRLSTSSSFTSYPVFDPPTPYLDGMSENEWWDALHVLCVELYPTGPEERKLWSQAEGDVSTLEFHGGGNQQWQTALNLLRRGGGGKKITLSKLLSRMQSDFSRRNELQVFAQTLPAGSE